MDSSRERLARKMTERQKELRIRWREVAARAGMTPQNLLRIRQGDIAITDNAADGIDDGLRWTPGSVRRVLAGGEPGKRDAGTQRRLDAPLTTRPTRSEIARMSRDQLLTVADMIREATGSMRQAVEFIDGATRIQQEEGRRQSTSEVG